MGLTECLLTFDQDIFHSRAAHLLTSVILIVIISFQHEIDTTDIYNQPKKCQTDRIRLRQYFILTTLRLNVNISR